MLFKVLEIFSCFEDQKVFDCTVMKLQIIFVPNKIFITDYMPHSYAHFKNKFLVYYATLW